MLNIGTSAVERAVAFYWPQTRFWELMAGSVLAHLTMHRPRLPPGFGSRIGAWLGSMVRAKTPEEPGGTLRNVRSTLGALLIATGIIVISKERDFPGWWAVLPALGAVLIISAGAQAWINRVVLSNRVLVWFGLISFPLYLWHWPLLSFARILEGETPAWQIRVAAVLIALALAWLTYRLIEIPIRFGPQSRSTTVTLLLLMLTAGCAGYACYKLGGIESRVGVQFRVINDGDIGHDIFHKYLSDNFYLCTPIKLRTEAISLKSFVRCLQSGKSDAKKIALIGDSHAEHLFIGLAEALPGTNIVYYIQNSSPFISNGRFKNIFQYVIGDPNIKTVILSGYWPGILNRARENARFESELDKTVSALIARNKKVYLAEDVPNFSFDPKNCKYQRMFSRKISCAEDSHYFADQHSNYYPILQSIEKSHPNAKILEMTKYFCDAAFCKMSKEGILFYRDKNHLNINGSRYLGKKIVEDNPALSE